MEEQQLQDAPSQCRLCARRCEPGQGRAILGTDLAPKLRALAAVQIQENDGLPSITCTNCSNMVYMAYDFKCQVEKCDSHFRQVLIKQSSAPWPTAPPDKTTEIVNAVDAVVPCIQKNTVGSSSLIENKQSMLEITPSWNSGNTCEKKDQTQLCMQTSISVDNSIVLSFELSDISHSKKSDQEPTVNFKNQNEIKSEVKVENNIQSEKNLTQENSNQSDDEKPLILRTKRHKCNYCIKSFANLSLLEQHAVIHKKQPGNIYICYLCDDKFSNSDQVKDHGLLVHGLSKDNDKILEKSKMQRVNGWVKKIKSHNQDDSSTENTGDKQFVCQVCGRIFAYYKPYKSHLRNHPNYNKNKLLNEKNQSPSRTESVSNASNVETAHSTKVDSNVNSPKTEVSSHPTNSEASPQTENVDEVSRSANSETYRENTSIVEDVPSRDSSDESEGENDDDDDIDDDNNQGDDDMPSANLQCNQCGQLVSTLRNLKRHLLTHSGLRHSCSSCGKDFSRLDKLREHQQRRHKDEIFDKSDSDNESLDEKNKSSKRKKGRKNRPHKCSICPKAFAQARSLANHVERHRRAQDVPKRYLCDVCSKCFAQSGSLVAHMRTHTGVKPYVCNVCSRAFTKSTYLQLHLRTHSGEKPYICQYCSRAFARANTLARHLTMHTGEAKYQCQICSKSFRRLTSLNEHTYTHTGQRPYACKTCSKRYNNAGSLYAHTKKCKGTQDNANTNQPIFPVSLHETDDIFLPLSDNDPSAQQLLIFTEKSLEESLTDEAIAEASAACQFMITNVPGQRPLQTNILEQFTIQESDIYGLNTKQFKTPYYGLYPKVMTAGF